MLMYNFPEQYSDALRLLCEGKSACLSTVFEIKTSLMIFGI